MQLTVAALLLCILTPALTQNTVVPGLGVNVGFDIAPLLNVAAPTATAAAAPAAGVAAISVNNPIPATPVFTLPEDTTITVNRNSILFGEDVGFILAAFGLNVNANLLTCTAQFLDFRFGTGRSIAGLFTADQVTISRNDLLANCGQFAGIEALFNAPIANSLGFAALGIGQTFTPAVLDANGNALTGNNQNTVLAGTQNSVENTASVAVTGNQNIIQETGGTRVSGSGNIISMSTNDNVVGDGNIIGTQIPLVAPQPIRTVNNLF